MKFSCTQENLQQGLAMVAHITARNVNLPILNNVLIEAKEEGVELVATNLEIGIRVHVRGKVEESGSFTVPAQVFANYVNLITAEKVDIEEREGEIYIHAGKQNTKIKGESAGEFPLIPDVEEKEALNIPAVELKEALSQVAVAAATDESQPVLAGVFLQAEGETLILAATNSHRLAEKRVVLFKRFETQKPVIIPTVAVHELVRVLPETEGVEAQVYLNDNQAKVVTPGFEMTISRLIEGVFPDYQQVIPQNELTTIIVNKEALVKAIKAAGLFSKSGIHDVNVHISPEKQVVTLTTVNNQVGENVSKVEAEIQGDSNNAIFNYRYLLDGLANISTEKVRMKLINNASPGVLEPYGEDVEKYTYIIMPLKQ